MQTSDVQTSDTKAPNMQAPDGPSADEMVSKQYMKYESIMMQIFW